MQKRTLMGRLSTAAITLLAIPAFAAAQHSGGAAFPSAAPARGGVVMPRAGSLHAAVRVPSRSARTARIGSHLLRSRNGGIRTVHRSNSTPFGFDSATGFGATDFSTTDFGTTDFGATDFQDVPGLGFDFPHLAATLGNHQLHDGRFANFAPFGFGGFLLSPSVMVEEAPAADSSSVAPEEEEVADDAPDTQPPPRRARIARPMSQPQPESAESAPAPQPDVQQYVFVRRDGGLVFAVAYAWENGILRYITPEGIRRSIDRETLDLNATQQFNEQRGLNFRIPA